MRKKPWQHYTVFSCNAMKVTPLYFWVYVSSDHDLLPLLDPHPGHVSLFQLYGMIVLHNRENLAYSAALKLPHGTLKVDRESLVDHAVTLLCLQKVQHSVVGSVEKRGISGGQRKRVNIGVELMARPSVLFLDEPTSGLDAHACISVAR
jgi:ABC-type taurine transport system ATPase subunit